MTNFIVVKVEKDVTNIFSSNFAISQEIDVVMEFLGASRSISVPTSIDEI